MNYRIVTYNNTSRKGQYIVFGKGKNRRTLKYNPDVPTRIYEIGYTEHHNWRDIREAADTYTYSTGRRDTARHKRISTQLKKGTKKYTTTMTKLTRQGERDKAYRHLVRPLVKNEKIYNILYQVRDKLKPYLAYHATIEGYVTGQSGLRNLGGWYDNNKSIEDYIRIYHTEENLRDNSTLLKNQLRNKLTQRGVHDKRIIDNLDGGYEEGQRQQEGTIKNIKVTIEIAV